MYVAVHGPVTMLKYFMRPGQKVSVHALKPGNLGFKVRPGPLCLPLSAGPITRVALRVGLWVPYMCGSLCGLRGRACEKRVMRLIKWPNG